MGKECRKCSKKYDDTYGVCLFCGEKLEDRDNCCEDPEQIEQEVTRKEVRTLGVVIVIVAMIILMVIFVLSGGKELWNSVAERLLLN